MATEGEKKRTQLVVYRHDRFYYFAVWLLSIVFVVLVGGLFYFVYHLSPTGGLPDLSGPEAKYIYIGVIGTVFFLIFFAMAIGLRSIVNSHRMAGPAFAIQAAINRMLNKDYSRDVTLRKKDFLKELAEGLNQILAQLREREAMKKDVLADLDTLRDGKNVDAIRARLAEKIGRL